MKPFGFFSGLAFGLILGIFCASAKAAEPEPAFWVNTGGFSKHFQDNGRNEVNLGLGFEYRTRPDLSFMAGYHKNSLDLHTRYLAMNYQPLEVGPFRVGASIGVMDGYPAKKNGGQFFAILPMASWEGERVGVNFGIIPNIPSQHVEGAFVAQIKWRLR